MLVGVISDIHSNLPAMKAVLAAIKRLGPQRIICAGDIVGYNASPDEVCALLRDRKVGSILGNHDRALALGDTSRLVEDAARVIRWTRRRLSGASREALEDLPARRSLSLGGRRILLVHGSPQDDDEYVLPLTEKLWPFGNPGADVLVMGHTHVQWTDRFEGCGLTVINPGSVGQPRDGDPRACYATFDVDTVVFRRVEYDVETAVRKIYAIGELDNFFGDRLRKGR